MLEYDSRERKGGKEEINEAKNTVFASNVPQSQDLLKKNLK